MSRPATYKFYDLKTVENRLSTSPEPIRPSALVHKFAALFKYVLTTKTTKLERVIRAFVVFVVFVVKKQKCSPTSVSSTVFHHIAIANSPRYFRFAFRVMLTVLTLISMLTTPVTAQEAQDCFFKDSHGVIKVAESIDLIPREFRASAQCVAARKTGSVRPNQIQLDGNTRSVDMASPIGRIELRWPRTLEKIFSRTPERALVDAARTASRALKSGGFPSHVTSLDLTWRVVFLDQNLPETQIPAQVVSNCHPGWMYPPADIFIVAQRVAAGCSSGESVSPEKADGALTSVLLHEMGHAIEFALLQGAGVQDPIRSEGFASWFEGFSARYSSLVDDKVILSEYRALGNRALESGNRGFSFTGSPEDYGLGALYFRFLEEKRGVAGIVDLYRKKIASGSEFVQSLRSDFGWSDERWMKELRSLK